MRPWPTIVAVLFASGCGSSAMEHWMVGQMELRTGNVDAAVLQLEASRRKDPTFAPPYLALAAARSQRGEYLQVANTLKEYLVLQPEHDVVHLYLAECLLALGKTVEAADHLEVFTRNVRPDDIEHRDRLIHAHHRLAEIARSNEDAPLAELHGGISLYLRAVRLAERGEEVELLEEGETPATVDDYLDEAIYRVQSAQDVRPHDPQPRFWLGEIQQWRRDFRPNQKGPRR